MGIAEFLISSVTVGSGGASSIDFTSIPSTYTDLMLRVSTRSTDASVRRQLWVKYNNSSSNYTGRRLYAEDGGVGSDNLNNASAGVYGYSFGVTDGDSATANTYGNAEIYIPNYTSAKYKSSITDSVLENNSSTTYDNWITGNLWSDATAINQVTITLSAGNFMQYSTAYLYGIKNS